MEVGRITFETLRAGIASQVFEAKVRELEKIRDHLQAENTRLVLENRRLAGLLEGCVCGPGDEARP